MPHPATGLDYAQAPFLAIWETTQACGLACRHCRAEAKKERDPQELTTAEAESLIRAVAGMGTPLFVFSGGDCLERPDLEPLIACAKACRLRVAAVPAATPRLTRERILALKTAGLDQLAISIDDASAALHDGYRQVPGAFDRSLSAAAWAGEAGLPFQVNTVLHRGNVGRIAAMADLVERLGAVFWEVFFLVPMGRAEAGEALLGEAFLPAFLAIRAAQQRLQAIVKVTEAMHFRAWVVETERDRAGDLLARPAGPGRSQGQAPLGVNAGKGLIFIDHRGQIMPSGFLPLARGTVRRHDPAHIYREDRVFRDLRDPSLLKGRCHGCPHAVLCGGSRARAWIASGGDHLAEDPDCRLR